MIHVSGSVISNRRHACMNGGHINIARKKKRFFRSKSQITRKKERFNPQIACSNRIRKGSGLKNKK